jgi:hypothetical protein
MSDFTGRREPETKERMQGILDLASFGERGLLAWSLWIRMASI